MVQKVLRKNELKNLLNFLKGFEVSTIDKDFFKSKMEEEFGKENSEIYFSYLLSNGYIRYVIDRNFKVMCKVNREFLEQSIALLENKNKGEICVKHLDKLVKKFKNKLLS